MSLVLEFNAINEALNFFIFLVRNNIPYEIYSKINGKRLKGFALGQRESNLKYEITVSKKYSAEVALYKL